uniref:Uncharacterized protein n=1 Tax=Oryza punctata TaxID=4537 RepID=A0A0E0JQT7_ORYPU
MAPSKLATTCNDGNMVISADDRQASTTVVLANADDSGGATVPQPPEAMPDLNYSPLEDAGDG